MTDARRLRVGEVYRYPRPMCEEQTHVDGLPNFFHLTRSSGLKAVKLDRGISAAATVDAPGGRRRPVICIRTSPNKAGTWDAPWDDDYREDELDVGYYGDNRIDKYTHEPKHRDPRLSEGNAALLDALSTHLSTDPARREVAPPLLYFRGVPVGDRVKGNVRFEGLAVLTGVDSVEQEDPATGRSFPNLLFRLRLLRQDADTDWRWIDRRRRPEMTSADWSPFLPGAWRRWIETGVVD